MGNYQNGELPQIRPQGKGREQYPRCIKKGDEYFLGYPYTSCHQQQVNSNGTRQYDAIDDEFGLYTEQNDGIDTRQQDKQHEKCPPVRRMEAVPHGIDHPFARGIDQPVQGINDPDRIEHQQVMFPAWFDPCYPGKEESIYTSPCGYIEVRVPYIFGVGIQITRKCRTGLPG